MELRIFWTEFSQKELKSIYNYYQKEATTKVAKKIVKGIFSETLKLKKHPKIGPVEELLIDRKQEFRYLIHKNYKIIYRIDSDKKWIEINDVFDTRQNPVKMLQIKESSW